MENNDKIINEESKQNDELETLINELHEDRERIKDFVYGLLDRYKFLQEEVENCEDTLQDKSATEDQKKYFYTKLKLDRKEMTEMLESMPNLFNNLTEIPVKISNVYIKKIQREYETFEDSGEFFNRNSVYEDEEEDENL